ncbi:DUF6296 family protein [Streptomyces sp. NBC_01351]|uniref:DUF6296 family protein n=1 Tax=Streptomyces sp. NBC_01351 TaxID=2903833 RepID=UPI002E356EF4|nr:DUF6296 family protein [Streptomyces sp. NBC_01351]
MTGSAHRRRVQVPGRTVCRTGAAPRPRGALRDSDAGDPVYEDAAGIVRAEISGKGEVRVPGTGGGQEPARVLRARAVA